MTEEEFLTVNDSHFWTIEAWECCGQKFNAKDMYAIGGQCPICGECPVFNEDTARNATLPF